MKILILCQYFPPDITAAAFRIGDMTRILAERGHDLVILTSQPHKGEKIHPGEVVAFDQEFPAQVRRSKLVPVGKGGARRYLLHYGSFVWGAVWQGTKLFFSSWRPDVIWVSSPPLSVGVPARFLSMLFRTPYLLEVRDIWPDSAVAAGQLPGTGLFYNLAKKLELYLYSKAAQIVAVAQPMSQRIAEQTDTPVAVVYNGISTKTSDATDFSHPQPNTRQKVLSFVGNIGLVQNIDLLVTAFGELVRDQQMNDWRLEIVGSGAQAQPIHQMMMKIDPAGQHMNYHPAVSRAEADQIIHQADALFLSLKDDPVLRLTIPSKLFDYLLVGKPIVGGICGEGADILQSTGANLVYTPGNLEQLKGVLLSLSDRFECLKANANKNRDLVLEKFTREQAATKIEDLLGHCRAK